MPADDSESTPGHRHTRRGMNTGGQALCATSPIIRRVMNEGALAPQVDCSVSNITKWMLRGRSTWVPLAPRRGTSSSHSILSGAQPLPTHLKYEKTPAHHAMGGGRFISSLSY